MAQCPQRSKQRMEIHLFVMIMASGNYRQGHPSSRNPYTHRGTCCRMIHSLSHPCTCCRMIHFWSRPCIRRPCTPCHDCCDVLSLGVPPQTHYMHIVTLLVHGKGVAAPVTGHHLPEHLGHSSTALLQSPLYCAHRWQAASMPHVLLHPCCSSDQPGL